MSVANELGKYIYGKKLSVPRPKKQTCIEVFAMIDSATMIAENKILERENKRNMAPPLTPSLIENAVSSEENFREWRMQIFWRERTGQASKNQWMKIQFFICEEHEWRHSFIHLFSDMALSDYLDLFHPIREQIFYNWINFSNEKVFN